MKVVVAPDSLKESLAAPMAAQAIARGVLRALPNAEVVTVPIADGGEGTTTALVEATRGEYRECDADDPLGRPINAVWGLCGDGTTGVIEMARASGLEILPPTERNPLLTSTSGTGHMIASALRAGVRRLIVGIGGSATVDGGTGMAAALGVRFLDAAGRPIERPCGGRLPDIAAIDADGMDPLVQEATIEVACDVTNPLTGPQGAARVYGPQKGATPDRVEQLEAGLVHLADVVRRDLGVDVECLPGAGAAGGLGAGLVAFLGAELRRGVETVLDAVDLDSHLNGATLAFTAEGSADAQSAFGKATAGVAARAAGLGVPCMLLAGRLGAGYEELYAHGVTAAFPICAEPMSLQDAMDRAAELLERAAEAAVRAFVAGRI